MRVEVDLITIGCCCTYFDLLSMLTTLGETERNCFAHLMMKFSLFETLDDYHCQASRFDSNYLLLHYRFQLDLLMMALGDETC